MGNRGRTSFCYNGVLRDMALRDKNWRAQIFGGRSGNVLKPMMGWEHLS